VAYVLFILEFLSLFMFQFFLLRPHTGKQWLAYQ